MVIVDFVQNGSEIAVTVKSKDGHFTRDYMFQPEDILSSYQVILAIHDESQSGLIDHEDVQHFLIEVTDHVKDVRPNALPTWNAALIRLMLTRIYRL